MQGDFQICISVPLSLNHRTIMKLWNYNKLTYNNCFIHILENSFKSPIHLVATQDIITIHLEVFVLCTK